MQLMLLRLFQQQVVDQCLYAEWAHDELKAAEGRLDAVWTGLSRAHDDFKQARAIDPLEALHALNDASAEHREIGRVAAEHIWMNLQTLFIAQANVSKLLWGRGGKYREKRAPLRDSLQVTDPSPLQDPDMRNNVEHFDERLDEWWAEGPSHTYVDKNLGPFSVAGVSTPKSLFRAYDPATGDVTFWGEAYNIADVMAEVKRLRPIAQAEAAKPH